MAVGVALQTVTYRDVQGRTRTVRAYIRGAADQNAQAALAQDWITKMSALNSLLGVQQAHGPVNGIQQPPVFGGTGVFQSVLDKALMVFFDNTGGIHRFQIPGPHGTIFRPDSVTVDQSLGIVSAFIIAVQTDLATRAGGTLPFYAGGVRLERRLPRHPGILVLDSGLTPGQPAE